MPLLATKEERPSDIQNMAHGMSSGEAVAFCPHCKTFQTVWVERNMLISTRKFFQEGSRIYHDCGSSQPCHLYVSL